MSKIYLYIMGTNSVKKKIGSITTLLFLIIPIVFIQARKMGDQQLATRISDPMLRAWLLMNLRQVISATKK